MISTVFGSLVFGASLVAAHPHPFPFPIPFPVPSSTPYATPPAEQFLQQYFQARSEHNASLAASYFSPTETIYCDAVIGHCFNSQSSIEAGFTELYANKPASATTDLLSVLGNTNSAIVHFVDAPSLEGSEIRLTSAINFANGKILRQTDYWNGRNQPAASGRPALSAYTVNLGSNVTSGTTSGVSPTVSQLAAAFKSGSASSAAALFDTNAVYEDAPLNLYIEGAIQIESYLSNALSTLPYGSGSNVRNMLGSTAAGGYEWYQSGTYEVPNGIISLEFGSQNQIVSFSSMWDASRISNQTYDALVLQSTNIAVPESG